MKTFMVTKYEDRYFKRPSFSRILNAADEVEAVRAWANQIYTLYINKENLELFFMCGDRKYVSINV